MFSALESRNLTVHRGATMEMYVRERYGGEDGTFHKDFVVMTCGIEIVAHGVDRSNSGTFSSDVPDCVSAFAMKLVRFDATSIEATFDLGPSYWLDNHVASDYVPCQTDCLLRIYPSQSAGMANAVVSRTSEWHDAKRNIHRSNTETFMEIVPIATINDIGKSLLPVPLDVLESFCRESDETDIAKAHDAPACDPDDFHTGVPDLFLEDQIIKSGLAQDRGKQVSNASKRVEQQHDEQCELRRGRSKHCDCQKRRNHSDFHRLWTGALAPKYNKKAWLEIERQLLAAGMI